MAQQYTHKRKPIRSVGTLKLPDANNVFSKTTYDYEDCNKMLGREGLEKYTLNNISYNKNYRFAFIKVHIDNITEYKGYPWQKRLIIQFLT